MKKRNFIIGLAALSIMLSAQEPVEQLAGQAVLPQPLAMGLATETPPVIQRPLAADPAYMQTASAAFKATQADPDVQAAEERVNQVRTQNTLRLEEAELALELVRLRKGEAAGVQLTPLATQRIREIESRLEAVGIRLGREGAAAKTPPIKETK